MICHFLEGFWGGFDGGSAAAWWSFWTVSDLLSPSRAQGWYTLMVIDKNNWYVAWVTLRGIFGGRMGGSRVHIGYKALRTCDTTLGISIGDTENTENTGFPVSESLYLGWYHMFGDILGQNGLCMLVYHPSRPWVNPGWSVSHLYLKNLNISRLNLQ